MAFGRRGIAGRLGGVLDGVAEASDAGVGVPMAVPTGASIPWGRLFARQRCSRT